VLCAPRLVFGGTEGVGSHFHILCGRTRFRRYRGASGLIFMFCPSELIFGGTEGVGSRFHVLRAQTHFRRYRGLRVPFSCFARTDTFSAVPRASHPVFMFSVPGLIFGGTVGVGSRFLVLRARTGFRLFPEHRVPFSCFVRPDSFSAIPRVSGPIFTFCAPELDFGGTKGVGSLFHVLRS
jgi:hypothetical protein